MGVVLAAGVHDRAETDGFLKQVLIDALVLEFLLADLVFDVTDAFEDDITEAGTGILDLLLLWASNRRAWRVVHLLGILVRFFF